MIKSKSELINTINSELSDNSTGEISPRDIRHNLIDILDSIHNILAGQDIDTAHYGTPDNTSARLGEESLSKLDLTGYSTSGNTAIGYAALQNNYQAIRNTALGAFSLNCNVHGYDNVAAGYSSVGGNTTGFGNVGIGAYTLQNNKLGDFNIAIGHGAGYYANRNQTNTLYIGSHNVDDNYICANPNGSGLVPLIFGDMYSNKLGINTRGLHDFGVLQVSGDIGPSFHNVYSLGDASYRWLKVVAEDVACSSVSFDGGAVFAANPDNIATFNGTLLPATHHGSNLGSNSQRWDNIYTRTIVAESGVITSTTNYIDKTLFLASSGTHPEPFVGYLTEPDIKDAGLVIRVSGMVDPIFVYDSTDDVCGGKFKRWRTNIGLELVSGQFLRASSFISPDTCVGLHLKDKQVFSTTKHIFDNDLSTIAGSGHVNFIADSGNSDIGYNISYIAQNSGVDISQRFLYRAKEKVVQDGRDKLSGFVLTAFDEYGSVLSSSDNLNRFAISSYKNSISPTNSLILMEDNETGGVLGVNNFTAGDNTLAIPKTIFNVRSNTNATARITSETTGNTKTRLQLMGECNDLADGLELQFSRTNNVGDINIYQNSGLVNFIKFSPSGLNSSTTPRVGIFCSGDQLNEILTIGSSGHNTAVALYSNASTVNSHVGYGKIHVADKEKPHQSHTLKFVDGSGNIYDLVDNQCDYLSSAPWQQYSNISMGIGSMSGRCDLSSSTIGNTIFGRSSLQNADGATYNTIVGFNSANSVVNGSYNVAVGFKNFLNSSGNLSNSIALGTNLGTSAKEPTLLIGHGTTPIISGDLTTHDLYVPNGDLNIENDNKLVMHNANRTDKLTLRNNSLTIHDSLAQYPQHNFDLLFRGSGNLNVGNSFNLMTFSHNYQPMSNVASYASFYNPYAELNGDLKLRGSILFADGSSLSGVSDEHSDDIAIVSGIATTNKSALSNIVVEGYASGDISVASSYNSVSSGVIIDYNNSNKSFTVVNRDRHTKILQDDFVIAIKINDEYRPIWVSNQNSVCTCCAK